MILRLVTDLGGEVASHFLPVQRVPGSIPA